MSREIASKNGCFETRLKLLLPSGWRASAQYRWAVFGTGEHDVGIFGEDDD
jgi:hypothetical protein